MNLRNLPRTAAMLVIAGACLLLFEPLSAQQPKLRATIVPYSSGVSSLAFAPDGKTLVLGGLDDSDAGIDDPSIKLWDLAAGRSTATLRAPHLDSGGTVAISPDGKTLASWRDGYDIHLWNVATGKITANLDHGSDHSHRILLFSRDGKALASGGTCVSGMRVWDVATGKSTFSSDEDTISNDKAMAFMQDGKVLASMDDHGVIKLWDVATGKNTATVKTAGAVDSAAFGPDGKTVATGGTSVELWEVATGKQVTSLKRHADACLSVLTFSPDGKTLAGADEDKTIQLWDVATGKSRATFQAHDEFVNCLAFSPDGKTLATVSGGTIKLWNVPKSPPTTP